MLDLEDDTLFDPDLSKDLEADALSDGSRNSDYNRDKLLRTSDWTDQSYLNAELEYILPLRRNMSTYVMQEYCVSKLTKRSSEPETAFNDKFSTMMVTRLFKPVFGFPVLINKVHRMVTTAKSRSSVQDALSIVDDIKSTKLAWVYRNGILTELDRSSNLDKVIKCYSEIPLHAFTIHARLEVASVSCIDPIWPILYDEQIDIKQHPGINGIIYDNSLIDVRPYEAHQTRLSVSRDPLSRVTKPEWEGFISTMYTPASLEAGRMRQLSYLVSIRLMTNKMLDLCKYLFTIVKSEADGNEFIFHFCGVTFPISQRTVGIIINLCCTMKGVDSPSLHYFPDDKLLSLSITSGCLMRPAIDPSIAHRSDLTDCLWIDSLSYHNNMLQKMLGRSINIEKPYWNFVSMFNVTYPFMEYDDPPRPGLSNGMSTQAICYPRTELSSSVRPMSRYLPILRTPVMNQMLNATNNREHINVPGVPLLIVNTNHSSMYEDSIVFHKRVNEQKLFAHFGYVFHPLPSYAPQFEPDTIIDNTKLDNKWWKPYDTGKVIYEGVSEVKHRYVAANMQCDFVRTGDKFATYHGQKFTVSEIMDDDRMPEFECIDTHKRFRPHAMIASSSIHKRGTLGQIIEGWMAFDTVNNLDFDPRTNTKYRDIEPFQTKFSEVPQKGCYILDVKGNRCKRNGEYVIASFGIVHIWQLIHLSRDKQQFSTGEGRSINPVKGRLKGGSVRFGEMEMQSMYASGLTHCISEIVDSSDMVTVTCCSNCRRLSILCDCRSGPFSVVKVLTRAAFVKFDIYHGVYSSQNLGASSSIDLDTVSDSSHAKVPYKPESFKYYC